MKKLDPNCTKLGDQIEALVSELKFLRLEAENMALSLEAVGLNENGRLCTPLARYRAEYPKKPAAKTDEINIEVIIRPQPFSGLARHFGGTYPANSCRDNAAIADGLRELAKIIESK